MKTIVFILLNISIYIFLYISLGLLGCLGPEIMECMSYFNLYRAVFILSAQLSFICFVYILGND